MENGNQINFCPYCGTKVDLDTKFCKECGKKILKTSEDSSGAKETNESSNKSFTDESTTKREFVYEGKLKKCPNCGELLESFKGYCPSCGYEIRESKGVSSVTELLNKLEQIEAKKIEYKEEKRSFMKVLFGRDFKDFNILEKDKQEEIFNKQKCQEKINLIVNFPIPNAKEDIIEFMILASSNLNSSSNIISKDLLEDKLRKAWKSKLDQVYEKAKLLMGNSPDFEQIKSIYDRKQNEIKTQKFKKYRIPLFIWGGLILFSGIFSKTSSADFETKLMMITIGSILIALGIKFSLDSKK